MFGQNKPLLSFNFPYFNPSQLCYCFIFRSFPVFQKLSLAPKSFIPSNFPVYRPDVLRPVLSSTATRTVKLLKTKLVSLTFNPLNAELNPICYLLALLGVHHFLHVSRIRVKSLTLRLLISYIYGAQILDVSRSHTTTQHSR